MKLKESLNLVFCFMWAIFLSKKKEQLKNLNV